MNAGALVYAQLAAAGAVGTLIYDFTIDIQGLSALQHYIVPGDLSW